MCLLKLNDFLVLLNRYHEADEPIGLKEKNGWMARPILHFSRASAHAPLHSKVMRVGHLLQPFHSKMDFGV